MSKVEITARPWRNKNEHQDVGNTGSEIAFSELKAKSDTSSSEKHL